MPISNSFNFEGLTKWESANLVDGLDIGLNDDQERVIRWTVPVGAASACSEWIKENRRVFDSNAVEFQLLDGLWRLDRIEQTSVTKNREGIDLLCHYRKGWITSLVSGSSPIWDDARLVDKRSIPEGTVLGSFPTVVAETYPNVVTENKERSFLLVRWTGVDPLLVKQVGDELETISALAWNPVINGEDYGSNWIRLLVVSGINQEQAFSDKSGTIDVLLVKSYKALHSYRAYGRPGASSIYEFYSIPFAIAQEVGYAYNKRTGSSVSFGNVDDDGLVSITVRDPASSSNESFISSTSCSFYRLTTLYFDQATRITCPENSMGNTYQAQWNLDRDTGFWSGSIEQTVRQTLSIAPYRSEDTHSREGVTWGWEGLYLVGTDYKSVSLSGTTGAIVATSTTVTLPTEGVIDNGQMRRVRKDRNEDCTYNVTVEEFDVIPRAYPTTDSEDDASEHSTVQQSLEQAHDTSVSLSATTGQRLEAQVSINRDTKTLDISRRVVAVKDQIGSEYSDSASEAVVAAVHTQGSVLAAPEASTGKIVQRRNQPTQFGLFATVDEERTAKDQTGAEYVASHSETVSSSTHSQGNALSAPTKTQGQIITRRSQPTPFGLNATVDEVRTAEDQLGSAYQDSSRESRASVLHSNSAELGSPSAAVGTVVTRQSNATPFGLHATEETVITAKDQVDADYEESHAESAVTVKHSQGPSVSSPSIAPGQIKVAQESETEFGLHQTQETTRSAKDQESYEWQDSHASEAIVEAHSQTTKPSAPSAATGEIRRTSARATPFGLYATDVSVESAKDQEATDYIESHDESSVAVSHTQSTPVTAPSIVEGQIVVRRNQPTPFGLNSTVDETKTAKDQPVTAWADSHDELVSISKHTQGDDASFVAAVVGTTVSVEQDKTPFGKVRSAVAVRTAKDQSALSYDDTHSASRVATLHTQGSALGSATAAIGTTVARQNRPTQFGLHQTDEVVVTAKDQTAEDYVDSHSESSVTSKHTFGPDVTAPTASTGTIVEASQDATEFGLKRTAVAVRTAKDQTAIDYDETHAASRVISKHTQSTPVAAPSVALGEVATVGNDPTPFGLASTHVSVTTAKNQTSTSRSEDASASTVVALQTFAASEAVPSWSAGLVVETNNTPTEFGLPRAVSSTTTAKNQTGNGEEDRADLNTVIATDTQESTGLSSVAHSTGVIVEVKNAPTRFGLWERAKVTKTAKPQLKHVEWTNQYGTCHDWWGKNQPVGTAATIAAYYSGDIYTKGVGATENEFGLEDFTVTAALKTYPGTSDIYWRTTMYKCAATLETKTVTDTEADYNTRRQSRYVFKCMGDIYAQTLHAIINQRDEWETDKVTKDFAGIVWPGTEPEELRFGDTATDEVVFTPADAISNNGRALIEDGSYENANGAKVYFARCVWLQASEWENVE